jgi:molecular chaperone GrpE
MEKKQNPAGKSAGENEKEISTMTEANETLSEETAASADSSGAETNEQSENDKLRAEAADWKDKYLRLYAEFENFRSRTSREKVALISTASEGLMKDLLPVLDDFERSLKAMETAADVQSLREGVELVFHKFTGILQQKGLKAMESVGKPFDADFHEAITQFPAPDPSQKGLVMDEVEKGYSLHDKTIRFAKVVIGA